MIDPNKILVHACCSACFSYVYNILSSEGYEVVGYFYNPSTHGRSEYNKRLMDLERFCKEKKVKLIVPDYNVQDFFAPLMPMQDKSSIKYISDKKRWQSKRCQFCYDLILTRTASEAKRVKIPNFTSTFLATPYKDHEELMNIGLELEREIGVRFFYRDFRKGYWQGRNYARSHKMHIATYCGCSYSVEEGLLE
jgi:predicted adenine nucleotide alpha hydrolase (AANH) superfamily ATPase